MAYFSNSSEGESFKKSYCYSCVHWNDKDDGLDFGCPVMDVHILFNSGHLDNQLIKRILNILIPAGCSMYACRDVDIIEEKYYVFNYF